MNDKPKKLLWGSRLESLLMHVYISVYTNGLTCGQEVQDGVLSWQDVRESLFQSMEGSAKGISKWEQAKELNFQGLWQSY